MSKVLFCFNCKHFDYSSITANCTRNSSRDLVYGTYQGSKYSCAAERGYDPEYISRSFLLNHEICGVEGKFFEVKQ